MTNYLRLILPAVAGFLLGVLAEIMASAITESGYLIWFIAFTTIIALIAFAYRAGQRTVVRLGSPVTIRTLVDRYTQSQQGLIVVVSLYNPNKKSPAFALSKEAQITAATNLDYQALNLEESNYKTLLTSIETHVHRLTHCWLIATDSGTPATSSLTYVPVIERYLREVKGLKCTFHSGPQYTLTIEQDDALVAERTRSLINQIFEEATQPPINIPENKIVADITGGFRSIPFGMILACLDKQRRVQFVGVRYDENAEPVGDLVPILFDYTAEIIEG